jgi:hypothetical protein
MKTTAIGILSRATGFALGGLAVTAGYPALAAIALVSVALYAGHVLDMAG